MPLAFIRDEKLWSKAKAQAAKADKADDYAYITGIYKQMGGGIGKKEAQPASGFGQLMRCSRPVWATDDRLFESLRAGAFDDASRTVRVIIVSEGPGNLRDRNYYTAQAIRDGVKKFNGARSFINHQSREERASRPEQDVWDQAGYFKNTSLEKVQDEAGKLVEAVGADLVFDDSEAGRAGYSKAKAAILYAQQFPNSQEVYAGLSINAAGVIAEDPLVIEGEDWNQVIGFEQVMSADVVTRPARGGRFQKLLESVAYESSNLSQSGESTMNKKKLIASLREAKADLKEAKAEKDKKAIALLEAKVQEKTQALAEAELMEAEDEKEADDPAADKDAEEDDPADAALGMKKKLGKLIPKAADESENEYESRLAKIKAAHSGKEEEAAEEAEKPKAKESLTMADLTRALESARASKPKELLESYKTMLAENRAMKLEKAATRLLEASELPEEILTVADLMEAGSVAGMASMIARHERLMDKFTPAGNPERGSFGGRRASGVTRESLEDSGLPLKREAA